MINSSDSGLNQFKGIPGRDGAPGEPGKDGKDGKDGLPGRDGRDGKDGVNGLDGLPGKDGKDGLPGEAGKDGMSGRDGIDGLPGSNGRDGIDGKDGINGKDGKDGLPGRDGKDGKDGVNGRDGKDGKDGKDAPFGSWLGIYEASGSTNAENPSVIVFEKELEVDTVCGIQITLVAKGPNRKNFFYGKKNALVFDSYRVDTDVIQFNPRRSNPALNCEIKMSGRNIQVIAIGVNDEELQWRGEVELAIL